MSRFRYAADPLCLVACSLYAINRFVLKAHAGPGFFHDHFNDLLLMPAALPWVLWADRSLGWRQHDRPPSGAEILVHTALWSLICEGIGPRWLGLGVADWRDVAAYFAGAFVAWGFWAFGPRRRPPAS